MDENTFNKLECKIDELYDLIFKLSVDLAGLKGRIYGSAAIVSFLTTIIIGLIAAALGMFHK